MSSNVNTCKCNEDGNLNDDQLDSIVNEVNRRTVLDISAIAREAINSTNSDDDWVCTGRYE